MRKATPVIIYHITYDDGEEVRLSLGPGRDRDAAEAAEPEVEDAESALLRNARGEQRSVEMRSGAGIEDDWNAAPAQPAGVGADGVPVDPEPNPMAW